MTPHESARVGVNLDHRRTLVRLSMDGARCVDPIHGRCSLARFEARQCRLCPGHCGQRLDARIKSPCADDARVPLVVMETVQLSGCGGQTEIHY